MTKFIYLAAFLFSVSVISAAEEKPANLQVIPLPMEIKSLDGQFTLTEKTQVYYDESSGSKEAAEFLVVWLNLPNPIKQTPSQFPDGSITFTSFADSEQYPEGGYKIIISQEHIKVASSNSAGWFYGAQTLRQLFWEKKTIDCVEIADSPRYQWRGLLLDIARHFFDKEQLKRLIDRMAMHKLNTLQLHLTDDQGWRIEIKRYPKLISIGSFGECFNPKAPSRFFTQTEMREIIAYARDRHIRIVPEIEMPSHIGAAVRSYPELLACNPAHPVNVHGFGECCPGKDTTLRLLEGVLDEIDEIFDSPFIHIGGDECSKTGWKTCPDCQKRIKENNLKDYNELQAWFIRHFDKYLTDKGRRLVGWDEILEGGLASGKQVVSCRNSKPPAKLEHDVVLTPYTSCYFDGPQLENINDGHSYFPNYPTNTNRKLYLYEPTANIPPDARHHVLGVEACMWTEYCGTESDLEWKIFPRLSTLAEIAWIQPDKKEVQAFEKRLEVHRERLIKLGINAAPVRGELFQIQKK